MATPTSMSRSGSGRNLLFLSNTFNPYRIDPMNIFHLEGRPHVTLSNLLKIEGWVESGAAAKHAIDEGLVLVDGAVELRKRNKIVAGQVVKFDGNAIRIME